MKFLSPILSALNSVEQGYIVIDTEHRVDGVSRERVFCYELYHQLRKKMRSKQIVVHGELDKVGYPYFNSEKPDFVLHKPGSNHLNTVVLEVKVEIGIGAIKQDIDKLFRFVRNCGYQSGGLIVVGIAQDDIMNALRPLLISYKESTGSDKIWLFILPKHGECVQPQTLALI